MVRFLLTGGMLVLMPLAICPALVAQQPDDAAEASPRPTSEQLAAWIGELDSPDFAVRRSASRKLAEAGKAAIGVLTEAAQSPRRETMVRSLEILKHFLAGENEGAKSAAREALETIAKGGNALAARRAQSVLDPPNPKKPPPPTGGGIRIGPQGIQGAGGIRIAGANGVRIAGGQIQIGKGSQVITTQVNGAGRHVEVIRGDGRQIVIEDNAQGVKVVVREKNQQGKVVQRSAEAKDAKALKAKNKDLFEIYQQYDGYRKNGVTITGG